MLQVPENNASADLNSSLPRNTEEALLLSVRSENGLGQHYLDPAHPVVRSCVDLASRIGARDVLDLACGRGLTSMALAQETAVERIVATDINLPGLDELAVRVKAEGVPVEVQAFDAAGAGLPANWHGQFDLVVAKDLYPFLDPAGVSAFVRNSSAALKDGGWLIFSAPSADSRLFRESDATGDALYMKLSKSGMDFVQTTSEYFSFATPESLSALLGASGFAIEAIEPFGREKGWMTVVARKH